MCAGFKSSELVLCTLLLFKLAETVLEFALVIGIVISCLLFLFNYLTFSSLADHRHG